MKNSNLTKAKKAKNDEFYTLYEDIEKELKYYESHFRNKIVYCNCDNPYKSNFVKYFLDNFNSLGLKGLRATCYSPKGIRQMSLLDDSLEFRPNDRAYFLNVNSVSGATDLDNVLKIGGNFLEVLKGDGSFDSDECLEILNKSDIVVTNPPFSLFNEFIQLLVGSGKFFLVMGNKTAIVHKLLFPLFMTNRLWFGATLHSGDVAFEVPSSKVDSLEKVYTEDGLYYVKVPAVHWFTNMAYPQRCTFIELTKSYTPEVYPSYDNYDAIEVSKTADIPYDYEGVMGVPITFLDKFCPEQFEIVGLANRGAGDPKLRTRLYTSDEYSNYNDLNASPTIVKDGIPKSVFARILIRNKHPLKK